MKDVRHNFVEGTNIFILGPFDDSLAENVIKYIPDLIKSEKSKINGTINVYINSYGGYSYNLWSIVHLLELAKKEGITIITHVIGVAFSAGSCLAIIGNKRYIGRNSQHLIHHGQIYSSPCTELQLERENKRMKNFFKQTIDHYKKYSHIPNIEEKLKDDNYYLNAEECIKYGLADEFIS